MLFNLYFKVYKKVIAVLFLSWFFMVNIVYASGYVPLEALPGVSSSGTNLSQYLSALFNIGVGLAGVLAVLMIVVGGVQFIAGASNPSTRGEAKKKITNAIFGLILASSSWLILYTINPNLLKNALSISPSAILSPPTSVISSSSGITSIKTAIPTPILVNTSNSISPPYTPSNSQYAPSSYTTSSHTQSYISPSYKLPSYTSTIITTPSTAPTPSTSKVYTMSDFNTVESCISKKVSGICTKADINGDGVIDNTDLSALVKGFRDGKKLSKIDTANDFKMVKECMSRKASGVCARADINKDGVINISDLLLLSSAFKYNVNGDDIVNFKKSSPITSCFFKEPVGGIIPPDPPCDYNDPMSNCPTVPQVQSFPVRCVVDDHNDKVIARAEFNKLKEVIVESSSAGKVNLRSLYDNLFKLPCGDFSPDDCDLFDKPLLGNMIYSTLIQYDTNKDGIADFIGGDPLADFNGDGVINKKDSSFINFLNESIFKNKGLVPINFTLGGLEAWMFDGRGFTDRQVVDYCIGKPSIMGCAMSDINGSCAESKSISTCDVTKADLDRFDAETPKFDVNKDGLINFSEPN